MQSWKTEQSTGVPLYRMPSRAHATPCDSGSVGREVVTLGN